MENKIIKSSALVLAILCLVDIIFIDFKVATLPQGVYNTLPYLWYACSALAFAMLYKKAGKNSSLRDGAFVALAAVALMTISKTWVLFADYAYLAANDWMAYLSKIKLLQSLYFIQYLAVIYIVLKSKKNIFIWVTGLLWAIGNIVTLCVDYTIGWNSFIILRSIIQSLMECLFPAFVFSLSQAVAKDPDNGNTPARNILSVLLFTLVSFAFVVVLTNYAVGTGLNELWEELLYPTCATYLAISCVFLALALWAADSYKYKSLPKNIKPKSVFGTICLYIGIFLLIVGTIALFFDKDLKAKEGFWSAISDYTEIEYHFDMDFLALGGSLVALAAALMKYSELRQLKDKIQGGTSMGAASIILFILSGVSSMWFLKQLSNMISDADKLGDLTGFYAHAFMHMTFAPLALALALCCIAIVTHNTRLAAAYIPSEQAGGMEKTAEDHVSQESGAMENQEQITE
mgnify:CR=1 FL=1